MALFLHQLKVLLWKNWLSVRRQPVWSLVLILWPVVIFIILAITRTKFPAVKMQNCFLAPRNLQSTGLFPFLQNYLCDTDTKCLSTSYVKETITAKMHSSTSRVRVRKRSADSGAGPGGSMLPISSTTNTTTPLYNSSTETNWASTLQLIMQSLALGKTVMQDLRAGDGKGALCHSIMPSLPAQQSNADLQLLGHRFKDFCKSNQTLTQFGMRELRALIPQVGSENLAPVFTGIMAARAQIEKVQNDKALWDLLLRLPQWIRDPKSFLSEGEILLNVHVPSQEVSDLQFCIQYIMTIQKQVQNGSFSHVLSGLMQTPANQSLGEVGKGCITWFQQLPCNAGDSLCWSGVKSAFEISHWLVTSLSKGTFNSTCQFNGSASEGPCNSSSNGEYEPGTLLRILQRAWATLKQNRFDELVLEKLHQEIISLNPGKWDPQQQSNLTDLLHLLLNTTDLLISDSSLNPPFLNISMSLGNLQTLLEHFHMLVPGEVQQGDLKNTTKAVAILLQTVIQNAQLLTNMSGFLSPYNVTNQTLKELQLLLDTWLGMNSRDASFNNTALLLKLLSVLNQPASSQLKQTFQNLLTLDPRFSKGTTALMDAFNLFDQIINMVNISDISNFTEAYLKQISNFLISDGAMQNNLNILHSYFSFSSQLSFLQSDVFRCLALDVLSYFTPSNLQAVSSQTSNATVAMFKLLSNVIPLQGQESFYKVANTTLSLVESVNTCQKEHYNCTGAVLKFQQLLVESVQLLTSLKNSSLQQEFANQFLLQFEVPSSAEISVINSMYLVFLCSQGHPYNSCNTSLDIYKETLAAMSLIVNITLRNDLNLPFNQPLLEQLTLNLSSILRVIRSADSTKLLLQMENVIKASKCYSHTGAQSLQCTLEMSSHLMELLQTLPLQQPMNDTLFVASSIAKNWLGEMNGTSNMYQHLTYLYNLTKLACQNEFSLQEIHTSLTYIVQTLEEIRLKVNFTTQELDKTIGGLLEVLQSANKNYTFPTAFFSHTNQQLESMKTQLKIAQWYVLYVKNQTEAFQTSGNIYPIITMTQLILSNVLSSTEGNPSLMSIVNETQYFVDWLDKSHIIPVLQSILNVTLQNGIQNVDQFINHTWSVIQMMFQKEWENGTRWHSFFDKNIHNDIEFALYLLKKYDREGLANLSSVLITTEKVLLMLDDMGNITHLLIPFNNKTNQRFYEMTIKVMVILYDVAHGTIDQGIFYKIYKLLLQYWNTSSFHKLPPVDDKLMDLLYLSMAPCLPNNITPETNQNCSAMEIIRVVLLILNDSDCQLSRAHSDRENSMTLNDLLDNILNSTVKGNTTECIIGSASIQNELVCLTESFGLSINFLYRINNLFGLHISWIQQMNETMTLISDKLLENNMTCEALDRHMVDIMHHVFENQSSPLQMLFFFVYNQTDLYEQDLLKYSEYWGQAFNIVKFYISNHHQYFSNDTMFDMNDTMSHLVDGTNPDKLNVLSAVWKILDALSTKHEASNVLKEFIHILNRLNRVLNLTNSGLRWDTMLSNNSLANIFSGHLSMDFVNLIKLWSSELNVTSVESCERTLKPSLISYQSLLREFHLTLPRLEDELLSNMSLWTCSLIHGNNSYIDWVEELGVVTALIWGVQPNATKYLEVTKKMISSFKDIVNVNSMKSFAIFITSLADTFKEQHSAKTWIEYQALHDFLNSLQSLVSEALSSGGNVHSSTAGKVTTEATRAISVFLKSLNVTVYEDIFSLASEILQHYFNGTDSTLAMNSLAQKTLVHIGNFFQQVGLQNLLIQTLQNQISSQDTGNQDALRILQELLHVMFNAMNRTASETVLKPAFPYSTPIFHLIKNIVGQLNYTALKESQHANHKNLTQFIITLVDTIVQNAIQKNVSLASVFPQHENSQAVSDLKNLVNSWISVSKEDKERSFDYSSNLVKIFYLLSVSDEKGQVLQTLQYVLNANNSTTNVSVLVDALKVFYDLIHLNNTYNMKVLSELYLKQLLNYLISDSQVHKSLLELSSQFNSSQQLPFLYSGELKDKALEMLHFLFPFGLQNISNESSNLPSALLNLLSGYMPQQDQEGFKNITNAIVSVLDILQSCNKDFETSLSALSRFQKLVVDLVHALTSMGNTSLDGPFSNSSLLQFETLNNSQIPLINHVFLVLRYAQGNSNNYSESFTDVYQEVLSAKKLVLNITQGGYLNFTMTQSSLEAIRNCLEQMNIIQQVLTTSNMTELLLQIQYVHHISDCNNQTEAGPLLCTFNLTFHLMGLLQTLPMRGPLTERIFIVTSIAEYWMSNINTTANIYQQLVHFYKLTEDALHNEHVLHTISMIIPDIVHALQEMMGTNVISPSIEQNIMTVIELLQPYVIYNFPNMTFYMGSAQLKNIEVQLKIVQWYVLYIRNQTSSHNMSGQVYPMYRLTQMILSNMIPSIHNWGKYLNQSHNITEILDMVKLSSQELDTLFQYIHLSASNQTDSGSVSQVWLELSNIIKSLSSLQSHNTSMSPEFTKVRQLLDRILAGNVNMTQIHDIAMVLQNILTEKKPNIGQNIMQVYNLLNSVLNQTHSMGHMNLTKFLNMSLDSFATMGCKGFLKIVHGIYQMIQKDVNSSYLWPNNTQFSNVTTEVCDLLHWNYSQNKWTNMLPTMRRIITLIGPLAPESTRTYFSAAENVVAAAIELFSEPVPSGYNMGAIMKMIPTLTQLFNDGKNTTSWLANTTLHNLLSLLLDLVWNASAPKEILLFKVENIVLEAILSVQDMLNMQNDTSYNPTLSFSSEIVKLFFNRTQYTSDEGSIDMRFVKQVWDTFKQSGLEGFISSKVNQLMVEQYRGNSNNHNIWENLLQLGFNATDQIISEASLSPPYITSNTTNTILQIVETLLPCTKNLTYVMEEFLQTIMNVTRIFIATHGKNETNHLEMLISHLTSVNTGTAFFNDTAMLVKLLTIVNQTGLIAEISKVLPFVFSTDNIQHVKLFLDALEMFNGLIQLDNTSDIQELSAIFKKYLLNGLEPGNQTQHGLYLINVLYSSLIKQPFRNMSDAVVKVLPFFYPPQLQSRSNNVSNEASRLFNLISEYIPPGGRESFLKVANASLLVAGSIQTCRIKPANCPDVIQGFQRFVFDVTQFQAMIQNNSLGEQFANSSLLQFESYDHLQISLINNIFLMLSYAQEHPHNSSQTFGGVFEEVFSVRDWILNPKVRDDRYLTIPVSLQSILQVLTSTNLTDFLLQVQALLYVSNSVNHTDPLLCSLHLTLQITKLLKLLPLVQPTHDRLSIISSIAGDWLSKINGNTFIYQQLTYLYNLTTLTLQHKPILHAINTSVEDIRHMLQDNGVTLHLTLNGTDTRTNLICEMLQASEVDVSKYNLSIVLQYNISELLENIRFQLDVVHWFMLQRKNQTGVLDTSLGAYTLNIIAQWMADNYPYINLIAKDTEFVIHFFNHSFTLSDLLHVLKTTSQNGQFQLLIYQAEAGLHKLSNISFFRDLLINDNNQKDAKLALLFLQKIDKVNMAMVLESINKALRTLQAMRNLDLEYLHQFTKFNNARVQKIYTIVKEGTGILYDIKLEGTISKEMIFRIYNFTYLLVQDEWNWVPFQNKSAMEAELLGVWYLAMSPFLKGNESQELIGDRSAQDVLHLLILEIFKNETEQESLEELKCQWLFGINSSDNSTRYNHTFNDIIYSAFQSSQEFHSICSNESLPQLAEEMACIIQVMKLSIGVLSELNNLYGLQIPWIRLLHESLTFICEELPENNSTFKAETQIVQILDNLFSNHSNPLHVLIHFLLNQADFNAQTSDSQRNWEEVSKSIDMLASLHGQFDSRIYELIEQVLNVTHLSHWLKSQHVVDSFLFMNWTVVEVNESISILETLRRALMLTNSGLDAKAIQVYQATVTLLKDPHFKFLFNSTNSSHFDLNLTSVKECQAVLDTFARFSHSVWVAFDPTHPRFNEGLLSNLSLLACNLLHFDQAHHNWISNLETIKHILSNTAHFIPTGTPNYFIAATAEKIVSFLSNSLSSTGSSVENIVGAVLELLIQEIRIYNNSNTIADRLDSLHDVFSFFLTFIKNDTSANIATEQIIIAERDVLDFLSKALGATSYTQAFSSLSELMAYMLNNTNIFTALRDMTLQHLKLTEEFTNNVQNMSVEPYGTVMNCLKNGTRLLSNQSLGHFEEAIQLIQAVFTKNNDSANALLTEEMAKQKMSQLRNLTTLLCGLGDASISQSSCYFACQFLTLLQTVADFVVAGIRDAIAAANTSSPANITSVIDTMWKNFQQELLAELSSMSMNWLQVADLQNLGQNLSLIRDFININSTGFQATIRDLFRNSSDLEEQLHRVLNIPLESINALMMVPIPDNKFQIMNWFVQVDQCSANKSLVSQPLRVFCNLSRESGYQMAVIFLQNVDVFNLIYRLLIPGTLQAEIDLALKVLAKLIEELDTFLNRMPPEQEVAAMIKKIRSLTGLSSRQQADELLMPRSAKTSSAPSFSMISTLLCNRNYGTLLSYLSYLSSSTKTNSSVPQNQTVQDLMLKYGIPNTSPFCSEFFLNLVSTSRGAFFWVLLKPVLYGQILYTPNTTDTQKIMQKTNSTLQQLVDLKNNSATWLPRIQMLLEIWPLIQQAAPLIRILQDVLSNAVVGGILQQFLNLNITELADKLNRTQNLIQLVNGSMDSIQQFGSVIPVLLNFSSCVVYDRIRGMNSVDEMLAKAAELLKTNELFAAVTFDLHSGTTRHKRAVSGTRSLSKEVKYTISMSDRLSEDTSAIRDSSWVPGPHSAMSKYSRGFVYLQDNIDRAIIEIQTNQSLDDIAMQYQPMPFPCYTKDNFLFSLSYSLPIVLMVAWVLFVAAFVKKLVLEKELRLHEYMKMMGVNSCSHFFAWFIESTVFVIITVSILVLILKFGRILPNSDGFILFLFLLDYSLSVIAMSYLISVFFHNTNVAGLSGSLIYIIAFFPFIVVTSKENYLTFSGKSLLCLFSPTALSYGCQFIVRYESQEEGIQWHNMYSSPILNDSFSLGWLCWLLLIDSMIYFIVGWYIQMVFPGKYGIGVVWYFPVLPSFWLECCGFAALCPRKPSGLMFSNIMAHGTSQKKGADSNLSPNNEPEPNDLTAGVSLHGLTKTYQSKVAVQNLNLNFYNGHITALLGHNGAGKTTTLSMLTGLFNPSSGTIYVYGEDIRTHLESIRKNMGVCMQYDVLFDHLTTKEHLLLYGSIKAPQWNRRQLHEEVKRGMKDTELYSHRHKPVKTLSGGMRRKLSICIALIGGSRVIILDEPTTGVDPCSRRSIWEVISKNKKDKTIILSTHHLDEAEILSDRIAFLEHGGLRCSGTPLFLKETFGSGYHLTLTKKFPNRENVGQCNSEEVTGVIQSHIPEAYLKEDVGGELVYMLPPFSAEISDAYLSLLHTLDSRMNDLHIGCYGISDTTIEEVFLKLTDGLDSEEQDRQTLSNAHMVMPITTRDNLAANEDTSSSSYSFTARDEEALTKTGKAGCVTLLFKKVMAIFIKRFHNSKRNWKGLISQILLPVLFVIASMGLGTLSSIKETYPELLLSPSLYGGSTQAVVFGNSNTSSDKLVSALSLFPGIDNMCLNKDSQCLNKLGLWTSSGNQSIPYGTCTCAKGSLVCDVPDAATPPQRRTYSGQMLYKLTGHNMENYLLTTSMQFIQQRYGGWSFGMPLSSDLLNDIADVPLNRTISKVWYNPEGYHSLPAFINSFNNILLRSKLPNSEASQYGISVSSKPISGFLNTPQTSTPNLVNTLVALCILVGYSITTASFVIYVVKEHHNGSKRLQHIAGVGETCYWVTNFFYDLIIYMIPVALSIAMIAAFKLPAFYDNENLGAVSLLFVLFGFATFAWMYLLAGAFKNLGMAFISYVCINLFIGINTIISTSVVYILVQQKVQDEKVDQSLTSTYNTLANIFKVFPQFCFGYSLIQLSQQQAIVDSYKVYGFEYKANVFSLDVVGWMLAALAIQGIFCCMLRLLINDGIIYSLKNFIKRPCMRFFRVVLRTPDEDEDVKEERERVESGRTDTDLLQLQGLTKIFHQVNRKVVAVNNMSLGIPPGECFGLLGVNGAGKTTTFKMLTGDISPSSGNIQVRNHTGALVNVLGFNTDWSSFGYCPQEDALDDLLTGEEHLYYYARIHGIPEKQIKAVSLSLLQKLQLVQYKDRITANYSCGTKRKLSTALALIGRPSILLLDEPSSGMDPKTKRHLWKIISEEVRDKCAVVLTSHSMEECEALCTRLAIMVKGKFQCVGSLQHIKSRFGSGFTVKMHLKNSSVSVDGLTDFMHLHFPDTYLKEHHFTMVEYHVPVSAGGVANIFDLLESNKTALNIIHFSVSQTTLDEVFINFAQSQGSAGNSTGNSQEFNQVVIT